MKDKDKGIIFLVIMGIVIILSVILTVWLNFKDLPDPLNVIAILLFSFGPMTLMMWYWLHKFYFPSQDRSC